MSRVAGEGMGESYAAERLVVAVFGHVGGSLDLALLGRWWHGPDAGGADAGGS